MPLSITDTHNQRSRRHSSRRFWSDPTFRSIVFQVAAIAILAFVGYQILANTMANLESRGIATGFGFLDETAGFGISQTLVEYQETDSYGRTFLVGLLNTALVSILGILFATLLGFLIGVARLSKNWLLSRLAGAYIETFRNIPCLLQILFWYFAVLQALPSPRQSLSFGDAVFLNVRGLYFPSPVFGPGSGWLTGSLIVAVAAVLILIRWARKRQQTTGKQFPVLWTSLAVLVGLPLLGFFAGGMPISLDYPALRGFNFRGGLAIMPELAALLLALSIYTAAFIAEIVRSGILSVSKGQTEAAQALALPQGKILRLVIIPQAMRVIIPPLTSQYLNLTKNSSLAMAIGYPDLVSVFAGTTLNQTGQAIEVIGMTMAVYLTLSILPSVMMDIYTRKTALVER